MLFIFSVLSLYVVGGAPWAESERVSGSETERLEAGGNSRQREQTTRPWERGIQQPGAGNSKWLRVPGELDAASAKDKAQKRSTAKTTDRPALRPSAARLRTWGSLLQVHGPQTFSAHIPTKISKTRQRKKKKKTKNSVYNVCNPIWIA